MLTIDATRFSLLELEGFRYLLPGNEVSHIALRDTIVRAADTSSGVIGHLNLQENELPLYVPNGRLRLLDYLPEERRFVACLNSNGEQIAVACDAIRPFTPGNDHLRQPLPVAQALHNSPLRELLLDGEHLYFLTNTAALITHLSTQSVDLHEPESTRLATQG